MKTKNDLNDTAKGWGIIVALVAALGILWGWTLTHPVQTQLKGAGQRTVIRNIAEQQRVLNETN